MGTTRLLHQCEGGIFKLFTLLQRVHNCRESSCPSCFMASAVTKWSIQVVTALEGGNTLFDFCKSKSTFWNEHILFVGVIYSDGFIGV